MADEIKIEIDSKKTLETLQAGIEQMQRTLAFQMFRALSILEAQIKQNIRKNSGLVVRTGALLNSVSRTKKVTVQGNEVIGEIGTEGVPYARIHEFGGTIFPVNKKFLAIPTSDNRRRDGTPKETTAELMRNKASVILDGIIYKVEAKGKGKGLRSKLTPMFYLKKSVKIPARPYIQPAIAAKQEEILKNFGLFVKAAFQPKG